MSGLAKFLAFDLGASSGRAIIGTLNNGKLSLQEVHRFPNGPVEKDGSIYWDYPRLCKELETGIEKALAVAPDIRSIGIDTWGVDYVFFGKDTLQAKRMPYNYRDSRTAKAAEKVWKNIPPEELYAATGIQKMLLNTVYQLRAHSDEHPEDLQNSFFLMMPDALALHLGARPESEYTDCSTTNLLNPVARQWDFDLIDRLGLPRRIFPKIAAPCSPAGVLSETLQCKFNCGAIPIIRVGSHDTASAVAAVPAPENGSSWAYISAGTWALLGAEIDQPQVTAEAEKRGFTNEGGLNGKIRFLTNIMGSWLFQETRRVWREAGKNRSFEDISNLAKSARPGKYLVNPNAAEFVTPGNMPERICDFCVRTGQGRPSDDGEIARAIYDSLALYFKDKLEVLAGLLKTRYATLNIVGGGTQDHLLMQCAADALGIPVAAGPIEATAVGNVMAQAMALGEVSGLAAARAVVRDSFEVIRYTPDADMHRFYGTLAERFAGLTD